MVRWTILAKVSTQQNGSLIIIFPGEQGSGFHSNRKSGKPRSWPQVTNVRRMGVCVGGGGGGSMHACRRRHGDVEGTGGG